MNRLAQETSPYLLQHAQNPVDWYPWGEEAFARAKAENKPILVSIGYSSCHWCHVMEHESFENLEVAELMNALYVNIKVDREEYPDVDHMYMDAVQAMTGSGGWPLNVFLTPDKKPFYGGTYFPPQRMHQRASWKEVLVNVSQYFTQNRDEVEKQALKLVDHLKSLSSVGGVATADTNDAEANPHIEDWIHNVLSQADKTHGGFGLAPKFPATHTLRFLLDYAIRTQSVEALEHVERSLQKMNQGGIYDHIGGGFARYSTDKYWFAPHFEKMLYDNALLLDLYARTYQFTQKETYKQVIEETISWLRREMTYEDEKGIGFYSAQDADSEGVEGKYYTWSDEELKQILGADYAEVASLFNVEEHGNWEHTNILYLTEKSVEDHPIESNRLSAIKELLLTHRSQRIKPLTDDKILLGWNALMNKALTRCYLHTQNRDYLALAESNMDFLIAHFKSMEGYYFHTYKHGKAKIVAFADDLAYLAEALYELNLATGKPEYKKEMTFIIEYLDQHYLSKGAILYDFAHHAEMQVEINKREIYDGATPSPNAILCNLFQRLDADPFWAQKGKHASQMMGYMLKFCQNHPNSFSLWCSAWQARLIGRIDVKIRGPLASEYYLALHTKVMQPNVFYVTEQSKGEFEEPKQHQASNTRTSIEVCKQQACHLPVYSLEEAVDLIFS
jgi:uncharacterized protein YyaL (SSP411 family)